MHGKEYQFDLSDFSVDDVYKIAVILEDEGFKFYSKIIDAAENGRVKNEIKFLRDEVYSHKKFFMKQVEDKNSSAMDDDNLKTFIQKEFIEPTKEYFIGGKIKSARETLRFEQFSSKNP